MKDNTNTKKRNKWVIEQMISDYKKQKNEEKYFTKPYSL